MNLKRLSLRVGVLAAIAITLSAAGCGYERSTAGGTMTILGNSNLKPALTETYLRKLVVLAYGDATLVRSTALTGEAGKKVIAVEVDRPPNAGNGSIEGVMASFAGNIMAQLFQYPEVSSVTITMFGADPGVKGDETALKITVDKPTAAVNDWTMFGPMTMSSMVSDYYINPKLLR